MRWQTPILIRWADIDAYRHVNNVALAEFLQEARTRFFRLPEWSGTLTTAENESFIIVAHQEIEYHAQVSYRAEPLLVEVWVVRARGAAIDLGFEIWDEARTERYVVATHTIALVPAGGTAPRRVTAAEQAAGLAWAGEPVKFRRSTRRG